MSQYWYSFLVSLLILLPAPVPINGYGQGAPAGVCTTMLPGHGQDPQPLGSSPYTINIEKAEVLGGESVKIVLSATDRSKPFIGFLVQGQKQSTNYGFVREPLGNFKKSSRSDIHPINCQGVTSSGMTHSDNSPKTEIELEWIAPNEEGTYVLLASFVQSYETYWIKQPSGPIRVRKNTQIVDTGVSSAPKLSAEAESILNSYYDGCGSTKGCFGLPNGCISSKNCDMFTTFRVDGNKYAFQVSGSIPAESTKGYVASGLSFDRSMGGDHVIGCVLENGQIRPKSYYNPPNAKKNYASSIESAGLDGQGSGKYLDGQLFCEFKRTEMLKDTNNEVGGDIDLLNGKFHLLLARASSLGASGLGYHELETDRGVTPDAVHMTYIGVLGSRSNILTQLHGGFMIIAWLLCASTGMFTARYYKQTHTDFNPFNKAFWFMLHITCMFTTVFLTICGIIFIFIEVGGYSEVKEGAGKAHPILGLILLGLAVMQVTIAFFRPHPGTSMRPLFNWVHWSIGNSAHIVGIACIFLAPELPKAGLKESFWYPLVAFVIFHVGMHIVMSLHTIWADKQMNTQNKMRAVHPGPMKPSGKAEEAPGAGFRTFMLTLYLFCAALVAIILVLCVAKAI